MNQKSVFIHCQVITAKMVAIIVYQVMTRSMQNNSYLIMAWPLIGYYLVVMMVLVRGPILRVMLQGYLKYYLEQAFLNLVLPPVLIMVVQVTALIYMMRAIMVVSLPFLCELSVVTLGTMRCVWMQVTGHSMFVRQIAIQMG